MTANKSSLHSRTGRLLHWATSALLIYGFVRNGEVTSALADPEKMRIEVIFASVLSVLFIVRYLWMQTANDGPTRLPREAPNWERVASKIVHVGLYVGVALVILTGYAIAYFAEQDGAPLRAVIVAHNAAAHTTLLLMIIHVAGALWHWLVRRDGVWQSMLWKRKQSAIQSATAQNSSR